MTLYDRQILKLAAGLAVRRGVGAARGVLGELSEEAQRTEYYEHLLVALTALRSKGSGTSPESKTTHCDQEAPGCWWTCPPQTRQVCVPSPMALELAA